jgi:hypothetical protein
MDVLYCSVFVGTCLLSRFLDPYRKHFLQDLIYCCVCVLRALPSDVSILLLVAYFCELVYRLVA